MIPSKHSGYIAGRRLYPGGGDSGGPTTTTTNTSNVPEYARPYVEDMLGRGHALTTQNGYQSYTGQRVANPSGLHMQSFNAAQNLRPAGQLQEGSALAHQAGLRAGSSGYYQPGQFNPLNTSTGQWNGQAAQQYMNPYMQQVVDIQKREAGRQSQMMGQQQDAQAVGAGAFGGSRHALVEAERMRNLGTQMNDIQAQGANQAWQQAQGMFTSDQGRGLASAQGNQQSGLQAQQLWEQSRQFGAQQGLAGINAQLNAANTLGQLGTSQFNQQSGIANLQNQFGLQQTGLAQAGLDARYQDWTNRQMHPYRQLEFQNNLLRGNYSPETTTSMYGGYGSPMSQVAGLGLAGASMYRMASGGGGAGAKKGGLVADATIKHETPKPKKKYAEGGQVEPGLVGLLISEIA